MTPDIWKGWTKNLAYPKLADLPRIRAGVSANHHRISSLSLFEVLMMMQQVEEGSQYVVEKRVTDDLMLSDIRDLHFSELPWPCRSLELYFEDPILPTLLIQRRALGTLERELAKFPQGGISGLELRGTEEEMDTFALDGHEVKPLESTMGPDPMETTLSQEEHLGMKELALLAYKVMLYASIPELAPKQVGKGALHHGGKPDVKNRPRRPIYRVVDLPLQYRQSAERIEGTTTKEFNGRRGHFHHYRSARFVNRKGEHDYFPPIYGPDGTLPRIRARVKKHEKPDQNQCEPAGVLVGV